MEAVNIRFSTIQGVTRLLLENLMSHASWNLILSTSWSISRRQEEEDKDSQIQGFPWFVLGGL